MLVFCHAQKSISGHGGEDTPATMLPRAESLSYCASSPHKSKTKTPKASYIRPVALATGAGASRLIFESTSSRANRLGQIMSLIHGPCIFRISICSLNGLNMVDVSYRHTGVPEGPATMKYGGSEHSKASLICDYSFCLPKVFVFEASYFPAALPPDALTQLTDITITTEMDNITFSGSVTLCIIKSNDTNLISLQIILKSLGLFLSGLIATTTRQVVILFGFPMLVYLPQAGLE
jgi:hypothetical protein